MASRKAHTVVTEDELAQFAVQLAQELQPGDRLYLTGELGSGKTTFTRYLLQALGSPTPAASPTFAFVHHHLLANGSAIHADLYRLTSPDDVLSIGLSDYLLDPSVISIIEWPERAEGVLPPATHQLHFSHHTPETRVVTTLIDE